MSYQQQGAYAPPGQYQQPYQQPPGNQGYGPPQPAAYGYEQHQLQQQQQYHSPPHHSAYTSGPPPVPARPGAQQSQPPPVPPHAAPTQGQPPPIPPRHQVPADDGRLEQRRLPAPPAQSAHQPYTAYPLSSVPGAPAGGTSASTGAYYGSASPPTASYFSPHSPHATTSSPAGPQSSPGGSHYQQSPPSASYVPQSPQTPSALTSFRTASSPAASYYGPQSPPLSSYNAVSLPPAGPPPAVASPPISLASPPATSPPLLGSPYATSPGPDLNGLTGSFAQLGVGAPAKSAINGLPHDNRAAQGSAPNTYAPPAQGYTSGMYHSSPQATSARADADDYAPRLAPPISLDGPTPAVLSVCPRATTLHYRTTWYTLRSTDWTMCTACFAQFVAGHPFASEFTAAEAVSGECAFGLKRPRGRRLLRDAQSTGELWALKAYVAKRATLKACRSSGGVILADGIVFFRPRGVDGFLACGECYEDIVLARPAFAVHWEQATQDAGDTWACDMWMDGPQEMYLRLRPGMWTQWMAIANRRLRLPACEGAKQTGGTVYTPGRRVEGLCICETCFVDHFVGRQFEHEFVSSSVPQWTCDMHGLLLRVAASAADERGDFDVLWNAMARYAEADSREAQRDALKNEGATDQRATPPEVFYTLVGPPVNFDVCEKCKACVVDSLAPGMAAGFVTRTDAPPDTVCDICSPSAQRGMQFVVRLLETLCAQRFSHFASYVRKIIDIPLCPRRESVKGALWFSFGQGVLSICPDCWESFASRTPLAVKVPFRGVRLDGTEICSMYSPRMRQKWEETSAADAKGDTGALQALLDFSTARSLTYVETYCTSKYLLEMQKIKLQSALHAGTMSAVYNGMNYSAIQSGMADPYKFNGTTYDTKYGVISEHLRHSSQQGVTDANDANVWFQCAELDRRWAEVE